MGICYCCLVKVNGRFKQRACQTIAEPGMQVVTTINQWGWANESKKIVIVGAGPSGISAATELARYGIHSRII